MPLFRCACQIAPHLISGHRTNLHLPIRGEARRNNRPVKIAGSLAARPGGTPPQAFADGAALKAVCRFLGQSGVSSGRILAPHRERTRQACRQPGEYLRIQDTTLLDCSGHPAQSGTGSHRR